MNRNLLGRLFHFKLRSLLLLVLTVTSIVFSHGGCKPNLDDNPTFSIRSSTLDFCVFNTKSFWVFENETTLVKDTVTVVRSTPTKVNDDDWVFREGFYQIWESTVCGEQHVWIGPYSGNVNVDVVEIRAILPPRLLKFYPYAALSDTTQRFTPIQGLTIGMTQQEDSIRLGEDWYFHTKTFELDGSMGSDGPQKTIWVKDVGKVLQKNNNGETWRLISYHIER